MAPSRQGDMARFAIRSLFAATIACFMTASIAGKWIEKNKETVRLVSFYSVTQQTFTFDNCSQPREKVVCNRRLDQIMQNGIDYKPISICRIFVR